MLSGEDLLRAVRNDSSLPEKFGQKDYAPDGSWLDDKRLESVYKSRREILKQERIRCLGSMVEAEWMPSEQRVKLSKNGKFSKTMGFVENGAHYLLPEEALFLMDEGSIRVCYEGVPLSLQEGYSAILTPSVSLEQYQVFAHFTRLGYTIRPYEGPSDVTSYEKKMNLDQFKSNKKRKKAQQNEKQIERSNLSAAKKLKVENIGTESQCAPCGTTNRDSKCTEESKDVIENEVNKRCDFFELHKDVMCDVMEKETIRKSSTNNDVIGNDEYDVKMDINVSNRDNVDNSTVICPPKLSIDAREFQPIISKLPDKSQAIIFNKKEGVYSNTLSEYGKIDKINREPNDKKSIESTSMCSESNLKETATESLTMKFTRWNFKELDIPDTSGQRSTCYTFNSKNDSLFPPGIKTSKLECKVQRPKKQISGEEELIFSQGLAGAKSRLKASNWKEYKQKLAAMSSEDCLLTSPVGYLWENDDVTPLVQPQDAVNTGSLLDKLKVIQNINVSLPKIRKGENAVKSTSDVISGPQIIYDGYAPNTNFAKTNPGVPLFRITVVSADDPVPDLKTIGRLSSESNQDDVPVIWAIVQAGDISFFNFTGIDLPRDIPVG